MLKFESFSSKFDLDFWSELADLKLNRLKLTNDSIPLRAFYAPARQSEPSFPSLLEFMSKYSLDSAQKDLVGRAAYTGHLFNSNTIEEFNKLDVKTLMQQAVLELWSDIKSGKALKDPQLLLKFVLFTYCDLKKFKFTYWLCCPAIVLPEPVLLERSSPITECFNESQISLMANYAKSQPVFVLDSNHVQLSFLPLEGWKDGMFVCMVDPSNKPGVVGWSVRNLLAMFRNSFPGCKSLDLISIRNIKGHGDFTSSIIHHLKLSGPVLHDGSSSPKSVGFERNENGKLAPKCVDLGLLMDPRQMAESVADLNLKLMRWRLVPGLNLEKVAAQRCLLLGSGTLGCYVARCLLGWGVKHITFVDNGTVSYSNLSRQPLFEFTNVGRPKAEAAAKNLEKIFPTVKTKGVSMSVPMPGHASDTKLQLEQDYNKLMEEVEAHDVIFLLMDSRESRWLPTVLGKVYDKIVINIALGFDSYLVMRHGSKTADQKLGCYFCNDVVAPTDSLKNRTLDQQCTVTRPGLAGIASSIGVELLVSLLQHPLGYNAPAYDKSLANNEHTFSCLGALPHQLRGFLNDFSTIPITGQEYKQCTACSPVICDKLHNEGFEFIYSILNNPKELEELTGLTLMHQETNEADFEWSDEE